MSAPLTRVKDNVFVCGVEISLVGDYQPSSIEGWQLYYNNTFTDADFQRIYAGLSTISFSESSKEEAAGPAYTHKVTFRFPGTDKYRSERITMLQQIKFVKLKCTNGLDLVIGRNDFKQNTRPAVTVTADEHMVQVEIASRSISPAGFTPNINSFGLPTWVPVSLMQP